MQQIYMNPVLYFIILLGNTILELYQTFLELSYKFVNGYADRLFDFEDIFKNVSNNIILKN